MTGAIFYVYEHWRPDTGKCFYVGKGMGRRSRVLYGRNQYHRRIQAKLAASGLAVEIRIVAEGLTETAAHAAEIERIAYWKALRVDLANLTSGGEGISDPAPDSRAKMRAAKVGRTLTEEHKAKIAAGTRAAQASPEVRAKMSVAIRAALATPEAKANLSQGQKARIRTKEHYEKVSAALRGRKLSPEHIEKTRLGNVGRKQSPEEIERRREANTGRKRSGEFCAHMRSKWTPERRAAQGRRTAEMNRRRSAQQSLALTEGGI